MFEKIRRNLIISIAAGAAVFLLLSIYADYNDVAKAFVNFTWIYLPFLFLLSFLNYFFRFLKWHYYLKMLNIDISFFESFLIFMAGLTMSLTPGKVGELLKCYLVKSSVSVPVSRTAPVVLAERITDFISLVLIAIVGALIYGHGKMLVLLTGVFFISITILLSNNALVMKILRFAEKIKFLSGHIEKIAESLNSANALLKIKPLLKMTLLSIPAWLFECLALFVILKLYGENISFVLSSFIYSFSTIVGSITMLPAGLGVTEGSLTFLLINFGTSGGTAVGSTFIIRIVTLWFAILTGIVFAVYYQKKFGKINFSTIKINGQTD